MLRLFSMIGSTLVGVFITCLVYFQGKNVHLTVYLSLGLIISSVLAGGCGAADDYRSKH